MAFDIGSIIGSGIGDTIAKVVGLFKLSPEQAAEHATELAKIQVEAQAQLQHSLDATVAAQAEIIKAEAQSQSWLPRNVRPLLLLMWGLAITFNLIVPVIARFWIPTIEPLLVPDWIYKLTAIGFTGYVTARTWEKVTNSDN